MTILRFWPFAVIVAFALTMLSVFVIGFMAADEYICFDRHPWWGPPESGTDAACSGHWYESRHPGEFPWTLPR